MKKNIKKAYNIYEHEEKNHLQVVIPERVYKIVPKILEYIEKVDEKKTKGIKP
ncbi:MAG: hypothetical protein N4A57_00295 [Anaeromicrobium sp.]|jgi:type III secretion system FlhB-like substrate exporter|uniref:hypothetical protein n=1 Tax=Anaeromicrobium sp. TaxID=1929132 RepID=UPI0025D4F8C6|nr:hypothetical protein [Anaeromicrobium sp.]MCT4592703.1 hypothetical protein [Anaeromicrobium sp.]